MDAICKIAKKHGLYIIEDACQADGGTTLAFKFKTEEDAQKFATSKGIDGVLPIDTGKHIYKHWTPVMEKRGSLHPLMDPFKMEANKDIVPDYTDDMCQKSLDILSKIVYVFNNPNLTKEDLDKNVTIIKNALENVK